MSELMNMASSEAKPSPEDGKTLHAPPLPLLPPPLPPSTPSAGKSQCQRWLRCASHERRERLAVETMTRSESRL